MMNKYYLFLLFSLSVFYSCSKTRFNSIFRYFINSSNCFESKDPNRTSNIAKAWFSKISFNFDNYSAPYLLKTDEALYYEGRSGTSLDASSAIVFKDGQLFAALSCRNQDVKIL